MNRGGPAKFGLAPGASRLGEYMHYLLLSFAFMFCCFVAISLFMGMVAAPFVWKGVDTMWKSGPLVLLLALDLFVLYLTARQMGKRIIASSRKRFNPLVDSSSLIDLLWDRDLDG